MTKAMERAGIDLNSCAVHCQFVNGSRGPFDFDAVAYVISLNIRRRHLTKQQQADLIVAAVKASEKPLQLDEVSKGGRGKVNEVKAKAVEIAAETGISKSTVERSFAKSEGRRPKPRTAPRFASKAFKLQVHIEVARKQYLELCAQPGVDLDAEQDIIIDALREIAGRRAMAKQADPSEAEVPEAT